MGKKIAPHRCNFIASLSVIQQFLTNQFTTCLFLFIYKDSILHNQSTRFNQRKGVRFQLDDLPPTSQVHNQQSDHQESTKKTTNTKSSSNLEKTQIKFQVKEAYVMKGGRKEFKNVLILCETRDGKIEIGWSNRAEDSPFRRHSM